MSSAEPQPALPGVRNRAQELRDEIARIEADPVAAAEAEVGRLRDTLDDLTDYDTEVGISMHRAVELEVTALEMEPKTTMQTIAKNLNNELAVLEDRIDELTPGNAEPTTE